MKKFKLLLILAIGFILGLSLSTLFSSLNEFRNTYFVNVSWKNFAKHYFNSKKTNCETLYILLNEKKFEELNHQRKEALNDNKDFNYVKASIILNSDTSKIKIKLKGDRFVHFKNESGWSFRIKTKKTIDQIPPKFSLHHPKTKNYIYEWLFHQALKREGIIALNYNFFQVHINNEDWGIYALEEHFTDALLSSNERPHGPIFSVKEEYGPRFIDTPLVLPYNTDFIKNKENDSIVSQAIKKLYDFYAGKESVATTFNSNHIAKYFALCDLLSTHHGTVFKSLRLFYNPESKQFEPIGFDGHYGTDAVPGTITSEFSYLPETGWNYEHDSTWYKRFFQSKFIEDTLFHSYYYQHLTQFSEKSYLTNLLNDLQSELDINMGLIFKDFPPKADHIFEFGPDYFNFNQYIYLNNQSRIKEIIDKEYKIHCFIENYDSTYSLSVNNISKFPIWVTSLSINDSMSIAINKIIPPHKPYNYQSLSINNQNNKSIKGKFEINYHIIGEEVSRTEKVNKLK